MKCPYCGEEDSQVKDSRPTEDKAAIRRRRVCQMCGGRFTTFERIQLRELIVIKKDGSKENFLRDKLARSVFTACSKRNIDSDLLESIISNIVMKLESQGDSEISSELIGELVMDALSSLDQVAYVRYASVYRNFLEARDFEKFIGDLSSNHNQKLNKQHKSS